MQTDFYTGVSVSLAMAGVGIGYWTFKPEIDKFMETRGKITVITNQKAIASPELDIIFNSNEPDTYTPSRSYSSTIIMGDKIYRKFLRVKIRNNGNAIAKSCDAKLQVLTDNKDGTNPSTDSKLLPILDNRKRWPRSS